LVIRDRQGEVTAGAAIFRWHPELVVETCAGCEPVSGGFVPLGHFRGYSVTVQLDQVRVQRRHYDRSDLATLEIYEPRQGNYYVEAAQGVDDPNAQRQPPEWAYIIFALGLPENPAEVKQPEKLVLSYYLNYERAEEVSGYFTEADWAIIEGRCGNTVCGCTTPRNDLRRVMVKQIAYETDAVETPRVSARVLCIHNNGNPDPINDVIWLLQQKADSTWRVLDVSGGP
jgi:hypothetical protein